MKEFSFTELRSSARLSIKQTLKEMMYTSTNLEENIGTVSLIFNDRVRALSDIVFSFPMVFQKAVEYASKLDKESNLSSQIDMVLDCLGQMKIPGTNLRIRYIMWMECTDIYWRDYRLEPEPSKIGKLRICRLIVPGLSEMVNQYRYRLPAGGTT